MIKLKKGIPKRRCLVPKGGVEPPRAKSSLRPERSASTSSTTSALERVKGNQFRKKSQDVCHGS